MIGMVKASKIWSKELDILFMEKKHFLYKLYPLSPTFYLDQNVEEKRIMQQHTQYWMV